MHICRGSDNWGEMTVQQDQQQVHFHASGAMPGYGEILRVWGMRDGAQPLLIGVAEPGENGLVVDRTMTRQYLSSLGYWPQLPEKYAAGVREPELGEQEDKLIAQAKKDENVHVSHEEGRDVLSCIFDKNTAFPFAFVCCYCTVKDGRAQLIWDTKKGCPLWTAP